MTSVSFTAIGVEGDGNLRDLDQLQTGLDNHFSCELHSDTALIQPFIEFLAQPAHPAINIVNRSSEPPTDQQRKHGVAPPTM